MYIIPQILCYIANTNNYITTHLNGNMNCDDRFFSYIFNNSMLK